MALFLKGIPLLTMLFFCESLKDNSITHHADALLSLVTSKARTLLLPYCFFIAFLLGGFREDSGRTQVAFREKKIKTDNLKLTINCHCACYDSSGECKKSLFLLFIALKQ